MILRLFWVGFLGLVTAVHFAVLCLANLPVNPISLPLRPLLKAYTRPLFIQSWTLFAPEPIDRDLYLLAQLETRDSNGRVSRTPWLNLTDVFLVRMRANYLTRLDVVKESVTSIEADLANMGPPDAKEDRMRKVGGADPLAIGERTALAYARTQPALASVTRLRLGLLQHPFPRFTRRNMPDDRTRGSSLWSYRWMSTAQIDQSNGSLSLGR